MYPKVLLLLDEIPQSINAGSIQFYRLLENYPPENLMVVGRKPVEGASILKCRYLKLKYKIVDRLRLTRFMPWVSNLEALGLIRYKLPRHLKKEIDAFKPDIVLSLMQLYMYYSTAYKFAKSSNLPLFMVCHDDAEQFSRCGRFFLPYLSKKNTAILKYASKIFCISPEMAEEWQKRYGCISEVLYPIPASTLLPRPMEHALTLRDRSNLTIGFAGSLAYGYREGFQELIPKLTNTNIQLFIYREIEPSLVNPNVSFRGFSHTPEEVWERIKEECDAVILPYSFDTSFSDLYATHFPSKLVEYLLLGMPVVVRGPDYATGIKWSKKHQEATVVSSDLNDDQLMTALIELSNSPEMRQQKSIAPGKVSALEFSTGKIKNKFIAHLRHYNQ